MRDRHIGSGKPNDGRTAEPHDPDHAHAGKKEENAPNERNEHGLPEIGLQHERDHGDKKETERDGVGRHLRPPRGLGEQPRDQHDEGRLEEL